MDETIRTILACIAVVLALITAWRVGIWHGRAEMVYELKLAWLTDKESAIEALDKLLEVE